jgi:aspartyl-tRNA(Asn)/glutamyl-tRNA(Gln) amidotransferase subunit B
MEKGQLRCDANISIRPVGETVLGTKVEIKNMNSFRAVQRAIEYEIERQSQVVLAGERIVQETRGFIDNTGETVSQRSKEGASDYRYFPEPDLPPLTINPGFLEEVREAMPELPRERAARFIEEYGLSPSEASTLTSSKLRSQAYEDCVQFDKTVPPRNIAKWFIGEIAKHINELGVDAELSDTLVKSDNISRLVKLVEKKDITQNAARDILAEMFESGDDPEALVDKLGLRKTTDLDAIRSVAKDVIDQNPKAVEDYIGGKESAIGFLLGQVMRATKGTADANTVRELLKEILDSN